jgi:LmbE family N-acetylglucosaminyl deacetylase
MKQALPIVLLLAFTSVAAAQKSPHTMMAVFAHADDEVFVGPLLAHYAHQGVKVHLVLITQSNESRPGVPGIPTGSELTRVRAEEARCACHELGIEPLVILEFAVGQLGGVTRPPWGHLARAEREIRRLFAEIRPEVVITFGPEGAYGYPDHRLAGDVVTQVVQSGADGSPHKLFYSAYPKDRIRRQDFQRESQLQTACGENCRPRSYQKASHQGYRKIVQHEKRHHHTRKTTFIS